MSLAIGSDHRAAVHPLLASQRPASAEKVAPKSRDLADERKHVGRGPKAAPAPAPDRVKRGVIRNLLAGHFRGAADARLRENFADELIDHVRPAFAREVMDGADSIVSAVREGVDAIAGTVGAEDAIALALDGFQTRIKETAYAAAGGTALDAEGTTTAFAAAFDDLRAALQEILAPNETKAAPVTAAAARDLATTPVPREQPARVAAEPGLAPELGESGGDLFGALGEAFDAELQALVDALQQVLAPLTPGFDATA